MSAIGGGIMTYKISGLLLMGGRGERFKSAKPKQLHRLSGKPVFLHTLETFIKSGLFHEILLACPQEWMTEIKTHIANIDAPVIKIIPGGATRRESSYEGLQALDPIATHVVIHDAVRPFVSLQILKENVQGAIEYGAVDTCIASADTIVHSLDGKTIHAIPQRSQYLRGQTPQSFAIEIIKEAHEKAMLDGFTLATDDCTLVQRLGKPVHIVQGDESNIKITTELDLYLAEQILRLPVEPKEEVETEESFKGKLYVIAGGTGGIGSSIAEALEGKGAKVISLSRSSKEFSADLSDPAQAEKAFSEIFSTYGFIDGLINSVGSLRYTSFHALSSEEIKELVDTNLMSLLLCCRHAKIKQAGHILNIASSSYSKGRKHYAVYSATKAAVVNFTQGLAEEMPEHYVNVLVPQRTLTPLRLMHFPEEAKESLLATEEVAKMAIETLEKSKVTGTIIEIRKKEPLSVFSLR